MNLKNVYLYHKKTAIRENTLEIGIKATYVHTYKHYTQTCKHTPPRVSHWCGHTSLARLIMFSPSRTTATNSGGLLASHVAGETAHNSHAHQPRGE